MKKLLCVLSILFLTSVAVFAGGTQEAKVSGPVTVSMWTQESESEGSYQYVQSLISAYTTAHADVTINLLQKNTDGLRQDFQTASLAGQAPDFLWTVSDHAGPFTAAAHPAGRQALRPCRSTSKSALDAVKLDGQDLGRPHFQRQPADAAVQQDLVPTPPQNTDELIKMGQQLTKGGVYGLVFNQTRALLAGAVARRLRGQGLRRRRQDPDPQYARDGAAPCSSCRT